MKVLVSSGTFFMGGYKGKNSVSKWIRKEDSMKIKHTDGRFYVGDVNSPDAVLDYRFIDGKTVQAYHTETTEAVRGQGVAGALFEAFINYVVDHDLRVRADCSYVDKKMKEDDVYAMRMV